MTWWEAVLPVVVCVVVLGIGAMVASSCEDAGREAGCRSAMERCMLEFRTWGKVGVEGCTVRRQTFDECYPDIVRLRPYCAQQWGQQ